MASTVELTNDFDIEEVLNQIEDGDIVDYAGAENLLDVIGMVEAVKYLEPGEILEHIGKQEAIDHFGLVEPGEEQ